jgi:hypothetical protein
LRADIALRMRGRSFITAVRPHGRSSTQPFVHRTAAQGTGLTNSNALSLRKLRQFTRGCLWLETERLNGQS